MYKHDFTDQVIIIINENNEIELIQIQIVSMQENESEYYWLPLPDSTECNRLLAAKAINFR